MNATLDPKANRRGVLLLVVVSMLTLFLMLGTTYLVVAARAKQAARAQAKLVTDSSAVGIAPARLLDSVLLKVVRGGAGGVSAPSALVGPLTAAGIPTSFPFESILADKYGSSTTGSATSLAAVSGTPLLTSSVAVTGVQAADLPGRVLTLLGPNREPTSHRILSAMPVFSGSTVVSGSFTVVLSNPSRRRRFLAPTLPVDVVLNGLEFDDSNGNEPYDAFDDDNIFLTHIAPADATNASGKESVAKSVLRRFGYVPSGANPALFVLANATDSNGLPLCADNDNDGTPDGFFLDFGLPSALAENGIDRIDFHASVLAVDLDSRFNVNAHGSLSPLTYVSGTSGPHPGWSTDALAPSPTTVPLGSGYGPAEISFRWMLPQALYPADTARKMRYARPNDDDDWKKVRSDAYIYSGADVAVQKTSRRARSSRFTASSDLPVMPQMEGRYAERQTIQDSGTLSGASQLKSASFDLARPGAPDFNDLLSQIVNSQTPLSANNELSGQANVPDTWWSGTAASEPAFRRSTYNSPPDLQGRMLTTTATAAAVVPRLIFSKPEWGDGEAKDDPYELRLDPRSARTGATMTVGNEWDNVFGYSELEALLRQYDGDAQQFPRRLVQLLGASSEEARLRLTTDSWDTTMISGSAASLIRNLRTSATSSVSGTSPSISGTSSITGIIANEVARGERLNLTRPLSPTKPPAYDATHPYYVQRQALFKDLYTLLVALTGTANIDDKAQWAANVVEFQDADSTITPFEYDADPKTTGWNVNGDITDIAATENASTRKVVWGAERPEVLIQEAFSWSNTGDGSGGVVVSLHRPWKAWAMARVSGSNTQVFGEPCDESLDRLSSGTGGLPLNQVDLGRKPSGNHANFDDVSPTTFPTWRLRIAAGGSTQYIRLDSGSAATANEHVISPAITAGASKPGMSADGTLTIASNTSIATGEGLDKGTASISISGSSVMVTNLKVASSGTVFLERLADLNCITGSGTLPGKLLTSGTVNGQKIWDAKPEEIGSLDATRVPQRYIVVDQSTLPWVDTKNVPPDVSLASYVRKANVPVNAFWATPTASTTPFVVKKDAVIPVPTSIDGSDAAWFVWPNRPVTSVAELFLVPKGNTVTILTAYQKPKADDNDLLKLLGSKLSLLIDSVHVPSRFAGIHTTINSSGTSSLAAHGIYPETTPVNQISSYREPGRVNLNTITSDDVWNAVVAGSLGVSGTTANPVKTRVAANFTASPAKTALDLLALSASGTSAVKDTNPALAAIQARNPLHELYTATRLANIATTRSNVFAVWITIRESVAGDPDSVKLHRGFYIVDRSIPVAYAPGKDHNVWDCIVLRRIIE